MIEELLLIGGGIIIGFSLGDVYAFWTRPPEVAHKPVADGWDSLTHVTIIEGDEK
jgi:hypothetical protein